MLFVKLQSQIFQEINLKRLSKYEWWNVLAYLRLETFHLNTHLTTGKLGVRVMLLWFTNCPDCKQKQTVEFMSDVHYLHPSVLRWSTSCDRFTSDWWPPKQKYLWCTSHYIFWLYKLSRITWALHYFVNQPAHGGLGETAKDSPAVSPKFGVKTAAVLSCIWNKKMGQALLAD